MWQFARETLKQPYRVIALVLGVLLLVATSVTIDKEHSWRTHEPTTLWLALVGSALIVLSALAFFLELRRSTADNVSAGVDLSRVKESKGAFFTQVAGCEIRVVNGRLEDYAKDPHTAVILPCNEYFDDRCVDDTRSALGAYVNSTFQGQVAEFVSLMSDECRRRLGPGREEKKTEDESAVSYGVARCVLLTQPLRRNVTIALLSTTTQRKGQGLHSRISYLFDGMRELVSQLGSARINQIVMPVLGAGHGGVHPPLALVGLLGALAEATRYAQGSQRLNSHSGHFRRRVTASRVSAHGDKRLHSTLVPS
jgi:Domain of unknown function (DUF6430)